MNFRRSALTPLHAWLLAVLLLVAQAAGLSHRVAHPQPGRDASVGSLGVQGSGIGIGSSIRSIGTGVAQASAKAAALRFGFDHQSGSSDCRLLDQLLHADALCAGAVVALAQHLPARTDSALQTQAARAAAPALYLARGPPSA